MGHYRSSDVLGVPTDAPEAIARRAHARLAVVFDPRRWEDRPDLLAAAAGWRAIADEALADHLSLEDASASVLRTDAVGAVG
jgi:hypothetical protein